MNLKTALSSYRATVALIAVNFVIFIAIVCGADSNWLALSGDIATVIVQPWTMFSYMFTQIHIGHLLANLVLLALAGYYYEKKTSSLRLLAVYFVGGVVGALMFLLICFATGSESATLIGSSASALAIWSAIVFDRLNPMPVMILYPFGRVKFVWILAIYIGVCVAGLFGSNPGGNMAHIGGVIAGLLAGRLRCCAAAEYKAKDRLVEKVEQSGFSSLSDEERRILFEKYRKSGK